MKRQISSYELPKDIRFIEDLRGKKEFRSSTYWVIGTDPNLSWYPNDFFKDKFSIAVNLAWRAFPESTFLVIGNDVSIDALRKDRPDYLKKCITVWKHKNLLPSAWKKWHSDLIYVYILPFHVFFPRGGVPDFEPTVRRVLSGKSCEVMVIHSTSHLALYSAAILGAKKIVMVASSYRVPIIKIHSHRPGLEAYIKADNISLVSLRRNMIRRNRELIQLVRDFGKHGVEIVRHRFDEKSEKFVFEEIVEKHEMEAAK